MHKLLPITSHKIVKAKSSPNMLKQTKYGTRKVKIEGDIAIITPEICQAKFFKTRMISYYDFLSQFHSEKFQKAQIA